MSDPGRTLEPMTSTVTGPRDRGPSTSGPGTTGPGARRRDAGASGDRHGEPGLLELTLAQLRVPVSHVVHLPGSPGRTAPWPRWLDPRVRAALHEQGIEHLWAHQVATAEALHAGHDTVVATGTASGKTIGYWLPALTAALTARGTTLYCTPTKALAADQAARLSALALPGVAPSTYDGDTDPQVRAWVRRTSRFVLTNPDMLHRGILGRLPAWRPFLSRLRYVVLDEGHMYRGLFGSHLAAIIARLRRACRQVGADPVFLVSSATLGDPVGTASALLGTAADSVVAVTDDESARSARTVVLIDPAAGDDPQAVSSAFAETARVLAGWTAAGVRSVGFLRSRAGVEAMAQRIVDLGAEPDAVTAYRGGLLADERRGIERRLRSGELHCVAATNALELGVDITGLDAVAVCGWPGTRLSFHQQLGRAGRRGQPAIAVLAAQTDPLDRFYVQHPHRIFDAPIETTVLDPANPFVVIGHLAAAIAELPMTDEDAGALYGPLAAELLALLAHHGRIRRRGDRWHWVSGDSAHHLSDLRGAGGQVTIVEAGTGRVIGTVAGGSAAAQLHPGAVYTHLGGTYLVSDLDLDAGVAQATAARPGYTTTAQSTSDLRVDDELDRRPLGAGTLHYGTVTVTGQVVGFLRRDAVTGAVLGSEPLLLPEHRLRTKAVWWRLPDPAVAALGVPDATLAGGAHAAEHAAIGLLPALATCDRWDVGGLSTERHPDTGELTVFVYDGHPGGAGFARRGFDAAEQWLAATRDVVASCDCGTGCPGCVQSPKCGNGNEPLDRAAAVTLLTALVGAARPIVSPSR